MKPDGDGAVEASPGLFRPLLELEHPPPRVQAHSQPVWPLDLESVEARGGDTSGWVPRGEKPRRQVGTSVTRKIGRDGQGAKIDRAIATLDVYGEWRAVEDDGLERLLQPLGGRLRELSLADTESHRESSTARHDIRHHGNRVAADLLEDQDGEAPPPLQLERQRLGLVREVHGLG